MLIILCEDLAHSRAQNLGDCITRALGNVGRVCVKLRRYEEAITIFDEKLQKTPATSLEKAWLLHDIGRCNLELGRDTKAKEMGDQAVSAAEAVKDKRWCLNAYVLVGQAECNLSNLFHKFKNTNLKFVVKLGKYNHSAQSYNSALAYAKELNDARSISIIVKVLNEIRDHIKSGQQQRPTSATSKSLNSATTNAASNAVNNAYNNKIPIATGSK